MSRKHNDSGRTLPIVDSFTRGFWSSCLNGKLVVQDFGGTLVWPPRITFDESGTASPVWREISGHGTVFTFSVVYRSSHQAPKTPYVLAVVHLDEGPHMITNIVNCSPEEVKIGSKVAVKFEPLGDVALPVFELI